MKQLLLILIFVFALLPVSAKGKRALLIGISEYHTIIMIIASKRKLTDNVQWVHSVETLMNNLNRQHLVMESTIR